MNKTLKTLGSYLEFIDYIVKNAPDIADIDNTILWRNDNFYMYVSQVYDKHGNLHLPVSYFDEVNKVVVIAEHKENGKYYIKDIRKYNNK